MQALAGALDENLGIGEVAAGVHLSASRLMTLAHEQLGTSLRAYRRWLRAFHVVRDYAGGMSLTEAAFAAGFASSPHLSNVAREQFGIRPSDILYPANRAAIQVVGAPRGT
jgi:AraC-like DNA-binding protein